MRISDWSSDVCSSDLDLGGGEHRGLAARVDDGEHGAQRHHRLARAELALEEAVHRVLGGQVVEDLLADLLLARSAERRVGKECVITCRSRGSPSHLKNNHNHKPTTQPPLHQYL